MTTGNTVATGVNQAGMAVDMGPPTLCEAMESQNNALREGLAADESESVRTGFGSSGATTVAHGSLNSGAPMGATSRLLPSRYDDRVVKGLWEEKDRDKRKEMVKNGTSNVCEAKKFKYGKAYRPHQSHCESKMLETMFKPGGTPPSGTLTLNINWQHSGNPNDKQPCEACELLLCHAQTHCGIKIELCQKKPGDPPKPLKC